MDKIIHTNDGLCPYLKESRPVKWKNRFKYIVAMKLFLLLLALSFHLSAKVFSQQISLNAKEESLRSVLRSIKKQSGYGFLLGSSVLKEAKPVTITLHLYSVEDALKKIFETQNLTYSIDNKFITIKPKADKKKELIPAPLYFPNQAPIKVSGKVQDSNDLPLAGVNIKVKGSTIGTTTDNDGRYSIFAESTGTLIFSYIGYVKEEVSINKRSIIDVKLTEHLSQLDETVVKGYYSTSKILNTGNVSSLKAAEIAKQPVSDPLMALEGRIPGLYIAQTSGVPGRSLKVNIRGLNSIANGNDPFYIIDGVPFNSKSLSQTVNAADGQISPFMSIRPQDIESIEVLKDADATAIYGSRGANGVILITTKKGKPGKTKATLNLNAGMGKVTKMLNLMNTDQYLQMRNEAFRNDGQSPTSTDYDVNGTWDKNRYTDWQKVMIGGTSHSLDAQGSISGGTQQTQFLFSSGYRRETTVFPGDYKNQLGSATMNLTHESENQKFHFNISANYTYYDNKIPLVDFTQNIFLAPNAPEIYKPDGELNWANSTWQNPFGLLKQTSKTTNENLLTNLTLSYNIIENLQIKISGGYNSINLKEVNITPFSSLDPASYNPPTTRSNITSLNGIKTWIVEPQVSYKKSFTNHHFDVLVGTTFQQNTQNGSVQNAVGFSNDELLENPGAASTVSTRATYSQYKYNALFAHIGYDYKNKYVLNVTGRRDGSSRFGPGKQFGNFGAIGAAWIFTKENLIQSALPFLSLGKLRGSIGKTGNDQLVDYDYLSTYSPSPGTYLGTNVLTPSRLTNPFYGWETINKLEGGMELGFIQDQILLNVSYYRNRTDNQLVGYSLPSTTGFSTIRANIPAIIQNKGLEIDLNTTNIKKKDFSWNSSLNISIPRNKLVSYPNIGGSPYALRYVVGQPLSVRFLYQYEGINPQTGLYTFVDQNKDGVITSDKDKIPVLADQKFFGGFNNTFQYKGFDLSIFLQFVKQKGYNFLINDSPGEFYGSGLNQPIDVLNRWTQPGSPGDYQKFSKNYADVYTANTLFNDSDGRVTDASFIRLKTVTLAWTFPEQLKQRLKLNGVRIYLQAQNLLTITNFKGLDPESQQYGYTPSLPPLRILQAGLQMSF